MTASKDEYLLCAKLRCAECGGLFIGETGTSKTGKVYHYYKCNNAKKKNKLCSCLPIQKDEIEDFVIKKINRDLRMWIDGKVLADKLFQIQKKDNPLVKELEKSIKQVESKMTNIMNAIENGFDPLTFKARYEELIEEKDNLNESLYKERINHPLIDKFTLENVVSKVFNAEPLTLNDKKFLIENFINTIYLHDDGRVDITYTFSNSIERIKVEDITNMCSSPLYLGPPISIDRLDKFLLSLF